MRGVSIVTKEAMTETQEELDVIETTIVELNQEELDMIDAFHTP